MTSEIWSGFVGLFMPYVVEFIKAKLPETGGKWLGYAISYGACLLVGSVFALFEGRFDVENVLSSTSAALIASQGYYNLYFKPSKLDVKLENKFK